MGLSATFPVRVRADLSRPIFSIKLDGGIERGNGRDDGMKKPRAWRIEIEKVVCRDEYERLGRVFQLLRSPPIARPLLNPQQEEESALCVASEAIRKAAGT